MRLFRPRWPRAAAEPCGTRYGRWWKWPWQLLYCYSCWVCRDPSYGLEEAASCQQPCPLVPRPPVCCQHTLLCLSAQRGDLYLGHVVALVAQTKEEGEQRTVHVALHPLLVVRHHGLHPLSEEADGELSQLAGLLGGRKKGGLQSQQLSAHGPRGQMSWRDSVPGKLPRQPSGPSTAGRAFGAVSHCLTPSQGQATASPNAPAPAANIAPLDAALLTMSALSDPLMTPPGNVESMTRSLSRKFFKIFFRGWGVEIIMSHMSRAALQESAVSRAAWATAACPGSALQDGWMPWAAAEAELVLPWGWQSVGGSGLARSAVAAAGLVDPQRWKAWWDGGSCSSGVSCRIPWLCAPIPTVNKPSWLLGPVPVSWWSDPQQRCEHLPGSPVSHEEKQGRHALPGWCCADAVQVFVDASHDLWQLEETQPSPAHILSQSWCMSRASGKREAAGEPWEQPALQQKQHRPTPGLDSVLEQSL
ncbi:uncharacterized protein [Patagioenas fasciata]|uniref:uncharacterized protein n=1 Tax=Patagioenas fasciata TaxID=372321 RepID=UPI003A99AAAE